jgi:hypothetical protein
MLWWQGDPPVIGQITYQVNFLSQLVCDLQREFMARSANRNKKGHAAYLPYICGTNNCISKLLEKNLCMQSGIQKVCYNTGIPFQPTKDISVPTRKSGVY